MKSAKWKDRCVVVAPRSEFIRPWIRAYFSSGNRLPLVIATGMPGEWSKDDLGYCRKAAEYSGGMLLDISEEWRAGKKLEARAVRPNPGWYTKRLILLAVAKRIKPRSWAWVDDDVEITGDLQKCFEYAEKDDGFICAQFYNTNAISRKHSSFFRSSIDPGDKLCWNSLVVFHNDANRRLLDLDRDFKYEDDEIIFADLYKSDKRWHNGFYDFSSEEWQKPCFWLSDIPRSFDGLALHYTSIRDGGKVKRYWAAKADILPLAPFENGVDMDNKEDAVDAVFVVGDGSRHKNEELKYALRCIDKNCKFIRNVYICGVCPSWVDKTKVKYLKWPDRFRHAKDANIIDKLRHACEQPEIAGKVLFCSDDQFVTTACTWDSFSPRYLRRYSPDDRWYALRKRVWHNRLKATLERDRQRRKESGLKVEDVFYYQPHIWMQIDKAKFIEYAKWCDYQHRTDTIIASGYFNYIDAGGKPDFDHTFIGTKPAGRVGTTHIAYTDGSYAPAMKMLKSLFPNPSRFEIH